MIIIIYFYKWLVSRVRQVNLSRCVIQSFKICSDCFGRFPVVKAETLEWRAAWLHRDTRIPTQICACDIIDRWVFFVRPSFCPSVHLSYEWTKKYWTLADHSTKTPEAFQSTDSEVCPMKMVLSKIASASLRKPNFQSNYTMSEIVIYRQEEAASIRQRRNL